MRRFVGLDLTDRLLDETSIYSASRPTKNKTGINPVLGAILWQNYFQWGY
ncbi:hypothetical protein SAMN06264348_101436 [Oceanospirillum linum]|nr:hypothetical protein SAMN04489856_101435 [Oleiphilus messinensis]SMP04475.1 hypothetical protein SAMN06264348_101436 [Oceanospirillum linum]